MEINTKMIDEKKGPRHFYYYLGMVTVIMVFLDTTL